MPIEVNDIMYSKRHGQIIVNRIDRERTIVDFYTT